MLNVVILVHSDAASLFYLAKALLQRLKNILILKISGLLRLMWLNELIE